MTLQTKILGENIGTGRYNPNLAQQIAQEMELKEQQALLRKQNRIKKEPKQTQNPVTPKVNPKVQERKDWVYVPSLGLYISDDRCLLGLDWQHNQEPLHKQGYRMPTIPEFIEFVKYIKSPEGQAKVNNANKILDEILTIRDPFRGEWLDAKFYVRTKNDKLYITYHTFNKKGNIIKKEEELTDHLRADIIMTGLNLDSWLNDHTKQGLPKKDCPEGNLNYSCPVLGTIGLFNTSTIGLHLDFHLDSNYSNPNIGVRCVAHPSRFSKY